MTTVVLLSLVTNPNLLTAFVIHEGWNCSYFTATFNFHKIAWTSQTLVLVFIIYHLQNPTKVFGRILPSFLSKNNADNTLCFSYVRVRNTNAGSWSFPGAAGQLPGPTSGRPTSQPEPFSWLTSQHLQPASYTLHLQHRSSSPTRLWNTDIAHFRHLTHTKSHSYQFLHPAPVASTDTPYTPSLYSCLEANAEQPEADDVFFDMLVKYQVRRKSGMSLLTNCVLTGSTKNNYYCKPAGYFQKVSPVKNCM